MYWMENFPRLKNKRKKNTRKFMPWDIPSLDCCGLYYYCWHSKCTLSQDICSTQHTSPVWFLAFEKASIACLPQKTVLCGLRHPNCFVPQSKLGFTKSQVRFCMYNCAPAHITCTCTHTHTLSGQVYSDLRQWESCQEKYEGNGR